MTNPTAGDEIYLLGTSGRDGSVRLLVVPDTSGDGQPDAKLQWRLNGAWPDVNTVNPGATLNSTATSVASYGIVGDGSDESAKWNALPTGKRYYVPEGNYVLNMLRTTGLVLFGAGRGKTTLTAASGAAAVIELNLPVNERVEIQDMTLQGGTRGLYIHGSSFAHYLHHGSSIQRLLITNCSDACLKIESEIYNCTLRDIELSTAAYGLYIKADTPINGSVIENIWVDGTTVHGVHIENQLGSTGDSGACRFGPAVIESNYGDGIYLKSVLVELASVWFEQNGTTAGYDLLLDGNGSNPCVAVLNNPYFSGKGPGQGTNRIKVLAGACRLHLLAGRNQGINVDYNNQDPVVRSFGENTVFPANQGSSGVEGICYNTFTPRPWQFSGGPNGTGININANLGGGSLLCVASRSTGTGNNTASAIYVIRCGYDGNNFSATYLGGTLDFLTWTQSGGQLLVACASGTAQVTFFANHMVPL